MAEEEVVIRVKGDDQASGPLNEVRAALGENEKALKETGKAAKDSADDSDDAAKSLGDVGKSAGISAGGLAEFGLAVNGVKAAYGMLQNTVEKAIEERMAQLQVESQLRFAVERATSSVDAQNAAIAEAVKLGNKYQNSTTITGMEVQAAYADIARATQSVAEAQDITNIAVNGAILLSKDLSDVTKELTKARKGDVGGLKEMNVLTLDQMQALEGIEDNSERGAEAMRVFAEAVDGAAESQDEFIVRATRLRNDLDDLTAAGGELAIELIEVATQMIFVGDSAEDSQTGIQGMVGWLKEVTNNVGHAAKGVEAFRVGMQHTSDEFMPAAERIRRGVEIMVAQELWDEAEEDVRAYADSVIDAQTRIEMIRSGISPEMIAQLEAEKAAQQAVKDELIETTEWLEMAQLQAQAADLGLSDEETQRAIANQRAIREERAAALDEERGGSGGDEGGSGDDGSAQRQREQAARRREELEQQMTLADMSLAIIQATTEEEEARLKLARDIEQVKQNTNDAALQEKEIAILTATYKRDIVQAERAANDDAIKAKEEAKEHNNVLAFRGEIARAQIEILQEEDELRRAEMERELALRELAVQNLTEDEQRLETLQIELDYRQRIAAAKTAGDAEAAKSRKDEASSLRDLAGVFNSTGSQMASDVGNVVSVLADIKEAGGSSVDALGAVGQATASFAGQLGASAEMQAGIMAIFETAMGFATLWTNPAESAAHFLAATNFGLVAGGVIGGSSGGSSGGASKGSSVGGGDFNRSPDEAARMSGQALAEALGDDDVQGSGDVYNFDFSGATMLEDSSRTQQRIGEATSNANSRQIRRSARG